MIDPRMNGHLIAHNLTGVCRILQYEGRYVIERCHGWAWRRIASARNLETAIARMELEARQ